MTYLIVSSVIVVKQLSIVLALCACAVHFPSEIGRINNKVKQHFKHFEHKGIWLTDVLIMEQGFSLLLKEFHEY